jgi:hypothetical protein
MAFVVFIGLSVSSAVVLGCPRTTSKTQETPVMRCETLLDAASAATVWAVFELQVGTAAANSRGDEDG